MKSPKNRKPLFERLKTGLEEGIRHAKGEITLKTTTLEMPDPPPEVGAEELTNLRLESGMSQAVFARCSTSRPRPSRAGNRASAKPSQAALRLIQVFRQDPSGLLEVVGMSAPMATASVGKHRLWLFVRRAGRESQFAVVEANSLTPSR